MGGRAAKTGWQRGLLAAALAALATACRPAPVEPPNVLLIVVDTLRADHLGAYGYGRPTSPAIDRLAASSMLYENAYSQAPWTTPSVGSLLTSRYPSELGVTDAPHPLPENAVLLSEIFAGRGYATGAVVSHYFLSSKWRFDQGFDRFDETNVLGHEGISSPGVTDTALAFVEEHRQRPFFLFVHYFDPHYDYIEHPEHRFPATLDYDGEITSGMPYLELRDRVPELDERDVAYVKGLYDSEIAFTDHHLGRLLSRLEELELFADALVVLTADHGEEFLDHGRIGHGGTLYDELIHVPLLIKYPRQRKGSRVATPVGLIDVVPTLLEHLGITVGHPLSGRSFLTQPGGEPAERLVFSETDWGRFRSVIRGRQKVIHRLTNGRTQVFDLAADPGERENLAARLDERGWAADFELLRGRLDSWIDFLERSATRSVEVEISPEERRQLRALGYLD